MLGKRLLAIGLLTAAAAQPALAGDDRTALLDGWETLPAEELGNRRGGADIYDYVDQESFTNQAGANTGDILLGWRAQKLNGTISGTNVSGNHGIAALMANTGDLVNMNNATSVNVYLR